MRVILTCGSESIQKRVKQMLCSEQEIKLIAEIRDCDQVLMEVRRLSPEAVILITDDNKSSETIIEAVLDITLAELPTRSIIMTENVVRDLRPAIKAGAASLLPRSINRDDLLNALRIPVF